MKIEGNIISVRHWFDNYYIIKIEQLVTGGHFTGTNKTISEIAVSKDLLNASQIQAGDSVTVEVIKQ